MTQEQSTAKNPKITPGRNAAKHPIATVDVSSLGWLTNNFLSVFHYWTWDDFKNTEITKFGKNGASTPNNGTQGHPKIKPASLPSLAKVGTTLNKDNLKMLQDLIDFAEKQVVLDYTDCKLHKSSKISATQAIVNKYVKEGPHPNFGTGKASAKDNGMCLAYVKTALYQKDYINGIPGTALAKNSGPDWRQYGFTDVSASCFADVGTDLPQVEISYIPKSGSTLKENPIKQPDLIYTLPGDVIVYEQVDPVKPNAPGHIDIRTYHHFASDFIRAFPLPALAVGSGKHFKVVGVYRKISDTMAMVRVQAFLRIIREHVAGETSLKDKELSYHLLQYDKDAKDPSAAKNPDTALGAHPSDETKNKSAGAYQISYRAWDRVNKATGWPKTFTPQMQDRVAMYLLQELPINTMPHPRRSALGYIMENKLDEALILIKQENALAHWPGGKNNPVDTILKTKFDNYVGEVSKK